MRKLFKYIFILGLFFLAHDASAFTCGVMPAGGNWNAAGTWHSCNGTFPQAGDKTIATSSAGNLVINSHTNALEDFDFSAYTGTLSGTFNLTVRGVAGVESQIKFGGTVTWTGQLLISNLNATSHIGLTTNGILLNNVSIGGNTGASTTLKDNLSFANSSGKSLVLTLSGSKFDQGGFSISGYAVNNRIRIQSGTPGTSKTIINPGTYANADFMDIALPSSTDLSAITGLSGDMGGNTNITFTTATTTYWIGDSGSWSDINEWAWNSGGTGGTSRVPLAQDSVIFDANSFSSSGFTVTADMPNMGTNIDFSLVGTDNPTWTFANTGSFTGSVFGSLTLDSGMIFSNISGATLNFAGRGTHTIDLQGVSIPRPTTMNAFGGSYTLVSAFISESTFIITSGTYSGDIFNHTSTLFSTTNSVNVSVNLGSGTWTVTGTGSVWSIGFSAAFNAGTSNVYIINTTGTAKTFTSGVKTYNNVYFPGDNITVSGASTYNIFGVTNAGDAGTNGLILTVGTATTTIANLITNATTTSDRAIIKSSSGGTIAGLQANTGGNICVDYMSIRDIRAYGTSSFYAGTNSLNVSGNIGWNFTGCPVDNTQPRTTGSANVKISSLPLAAGAPGWYNGAWTYRKKIAIDPQKVGSSTTSYLNNFPMLVSVIDTDLKVTGSGGKVASSTAGDIIFTAGDGTTLLNFEIEKYVSTTGELVAWVKIPFVSSTSTIPIYMYVGNASASYLQNATGVWDSDYEGVWHLPDGTTLSVNDSTGVNHGTNTGTPSAITAKVDGGVNYDGTSNYTITPAMGSMNEFTVSMWVKPSGASEEAVISKYNNGPVLYTDWLMEVVTNKPTFKTWTGGYHALYSDTVIPSGVWSHVVYTFDASFVKRIYINGSVDPSTYTLGSAADTHSQPVGFGGHDLGWAYTKKPGDMDEIRISSALRSSDWIKTEYNNQSNPNTFYSYGGLENYNGRVNSSGGVAPAVKVRGGVKFR